MTQGTNITNEVRTMAQSIREIPTSDILDRLVSMMQSGEIDKARLLRKLQLRPAGRPPKPAADRRSETVTIRVTTAEKRRIQRIARARRTTVTDLILSLVDEAQGSQAATV